jgi:cytochrome c oxidase assembly protein subunit 15
MIHRYAAGTLGFLILIIAALAIQYRRQPVLKPALAIGLLALVMAQGMLGMLTVTWQLKPLIVTAHLLLGLATLSLLWWIVLTLARFRPLAVATVGAAGAPGTITSLDAAAGSRLQRWAIAALAVLVVQIWLGGWTSSNYAATACPDLPKCQNAWLPTTDFRNAFVLWRGLGVNYEGGVLDQPARVAIQYTHRLGAMLTTLILLLTARLGLRAVAGGRVRRATGALLVTLALQLVIAIAMIVSGFSLWLATAHNAGAALLLLAAVALVHAAATRETYER